MSLADLVAGVALISLIVYSLLGGADFGGGVWDLLAHGPRAKEQREVVERAIAPVWEANHVWLILVVVLLFTGFPVGFSALSIALHVPLTAMLLGIVFRGSAFTFRQYDTGNDEVQRRWGRLFAIASAATPVLLGICLGTIASGAIRLTGGVPTTGFFRPWLAPFPLAVGLLTLALFAYLAAVYLTVEAVEPALRDDFRRRALASGVVAALAAALAVLVAGHTEGTRAFRERLLDGAGPAVVGAAVAAALGAGVALYTRRFRLARVLAAAEVTLVIGGFGLAQHPYLIAPDLRFADAAAPAATLKLLLGALALGSVTLFPSLYLLFRIFKRGPAFRELDEPQEKNPPGEAGRK